MCIRDRLQPQRELSLAQLSPSLLCNIFITPAMLCPLTCSQVNYKLTSRPARCKAEGECVWQGWISGTQRGTTISNPRAAILSDNDQISQDLAPKPELSDSDLNKELGGKPKEDTRLADIWLSIYMACFVTSSECNLNFSSDQVQVRTNLNCKDWNKSNQQNHWEIYLPLVSQIHVYSPVFSRESHQSWVFATRCAIPSTILNPQENLVHRSFSHGPLISPV